MKTVRIWYPNDGANPNTDYHDLSSLEFPTSDILSLSENSAVSLIGDELYIDNMTAVLRYEDSVPRAFSPSDYDLLLTNNSPKQILMVSSKPFDIRLLPYGSIVELMNETMTAVVGRYYSESVTRLSRDTYQVKAVSAIGLMNRQRSVGGIISGVPFSQVVADILGDVGRNFQYSCDNDVANTKVYGWLPFSTKRRNLNQLLLAYGVNIVRDANAHMKFTFITSNTNTDKADNEIYLQGSVKYEDPASHLSVLEHAFDFRTAMEEVELFNNTSTFIDADWTLVTFDQPIDPATLHKASDDQTLVIHPLSANPNVLPADLTWVEGQYLNDNGVATNNTNFHYSSLIPVTEKNLYILKFTVAATGRMRVQEYDSTANDTNIQDGRIQQVYSEQFTSGDETAEIRLSPRTAYIRLSTRKNTTNITLQRAYHENYAYVSGTGILMGKPYMHTVIELTADNENAIVERNVAVEEATLITMMNSPNCLERLKQYYFHGAKINTAFLMNGERCGIQYRLNNPFGEQTRGFLTSLTTNYSAVDKGDCELIQGYEPTAWGNSYEHVVCKTSNGSFTITQEMANKSNPVVRCVLIGRGYTGLKGEDGEEGQGRKQVQAALDSGKASWASPYWKTHFPGGRGGAGGRGGDGGKIYSVVINVKDHAGEQINFTIASNESQYPTTISYWGNEASSEQGFSNPDGYRDPVTGIIYAKQGYDGYAGMDGGRGGFYNDIQGELIEPEDGQDYDAEVDGVTIHKDGGRCSEKFQLQPNVDLRIGLGQLYTAGCGGGGASFNNNGGYAPNALGGTYTIYDYKVQKQTVTRTAPDDSCLWEEESWWDSNKVTGRKVAHQIKYTDDSTVTPNQHVWIACLDGGAGGAGDVSPVAPDTYGCGGTGGNGGGGGGGSVAPTEVYPEGDSNSRMVRVTMFVGNGGAGGIGGNGTAGKKGCLLIYY